MNYMDQPFGMRSSMGGGAPGGGFTSPSMHWYDNPRHNNVRRFQEPTRPGFMGTGAMASRSSAPPLASPYTYTGPTMRLLGQNDLAALTPSQPGVGGSPLPPSRPGGPGGPGRPEPLFGMGGMGGGRFGAGYPGPGRFFL